MIKGGGSQLLDIPQVEEVVENLPLLDPAQLLPGVVGGVVGGKPARQSTSRFAMDTRPTLRVTDDAAENRINTKQSKKEAPNPGSRSSYQSKASVISASASGRMTSRRIIVY